MSKKNPVSIVPRDQLPLGEAHLKHQEKRRELLKKSGYNYTKKTGRPTNYLPDFCQTLIEIADDPNTVTLLQEFCSRVHATESKVYEWMKAHSEFREAYKLAQAKWENKFTNKCFLENKSPILFKFLMNRQRGIQVDQTEVVHSVKNVAELQKLLCDDETEVTDIN